MIRCPNCREMYNPPQYGMRHHCKPKYSSDTPARRDDDAFINNVMPSIPSFDPPSPSPAYSPPDSAPATPSFDGGGGDSGGGGSSGDY